jgi:mRNA-degrading endonuclease RelE of RelBE toxin-antitoxin system
VDEPRVPITVAETPTFSKEADRILGEQSRQRLIDFLGLNPEAGAVIPGTGGVRKLRWVVPGKGKRGGARVIYYFHNEELPLLALNVYAKSDKTDISPGEKKHLKAEVHEYVKNLWGGKR